MSTNDDFFNICFTIQKKYTTDNLLYIVVLYSIIMLNSRKPKFKFSTNPRRLRPGNAPPRPHPPVSQQDFPTKHIPEKVTPPFLSKPLNLSTPPHPSPLIGASRPLLPSSSSPPPKKNPPDSDIRKRNSIDLLNHRVYHLSPSTGRTLHFQFVGVCGCR